MKINGIGTIKKEEAMKILTREGREAVKSGEITTEELGRMYKLEMVQKLSKIGKYGCTFAENYNRVPQEIADKLSPEEIAELVDSFYDCYSDGRKRGEQNEGTFKQRAKIKKGYRANATRTCQ